MDCLYNQICGGCIHRNLTDEEYRKSKLLKLKQILQHLDCKNYQLCSPVFIPDGNRRRASFTFIYNKNSLRFGFNESSSHNIADIDKCLLLTSKINSIIPNLRNLIIALCSQTYQIKSGKKIVTQKLSQGDVLVCETDNGLDIVLEYNAPIDVNTRMIIAEFIQANDSVIRISHRNKPDETAEVLVQKAIPCIKMGNYNVQIPAGTFLQATQEGEKVLAQLVIKYLKGIKGKIADLFCGVGTFSYYISSYLQDIDIFSVDSDINLLSGFKDSLNANQISNIKIHRQNLFKYPLTAEEISTFDAIVFDPPRAGAKQQCRNIALADKKPDVVIAVSCNPLTFVNDANTLTKGGYSLQEITLVDQFTYSNHSELVALFTL